MPTTLYTSKSIASVSHKGIQYPVEDGAVEVPDDAVAILCESHGFTTANPGPHTEKPDNATPVDKPRKAGRPRKEDE